MKKIITLIIALTLCLAMAACGSEKPAPPADANASNEITQLLDEGLYISMTSATEEYWRGILESEYSEGLVLAEAKLTADKYEELTSIEYDDEDGMKAFLGSLTDVTITDISDKLPSHGELDEYIGMTIGELENLGYENSGWSGDDGDYQFFYEGPVYSIVVKPEEGTVIEDMDDYSANDIRSLVIGSVEYAGISYNILDEM